ncbi:MAG: TIM barrel protein [Chloroflexi bacterium]|nr:TIM barrel protein [Chloroflexota bacterium]
MAAEAAARPKPRDGVWLPELSVTSWSFPACTLAEVAGIARALGIGAVDVGLFYAAALDRGQILGSPGAAAEALGELGVVVGSYYHLFGATLAERNLADPTSLADNVAEFRQVVAFCREAGVPTVMVLPGVVNPGQSRADALVQSACALGEMVPLAREAGVTLTVEPPTSTRTSNPPHWCSSCWRACQASSLRSITRISSASGTGKRRSIR